ncbi:PQQ-dependent sugar dehydrogenase [Nocardioides guangzhouensis]|uniref:PQQ-dependent sugar dehydrogenase n=1 Tax=Nocardioides guangzhouensis TaxID=2497878 RepID=A0A4Q4Z503_9ACTN|nr:PQQ-dependent sugar dehydrogenase [Nocardioides guangzhouensis]RYP82840.1 PQQ-dependent sugar dehydrogenase [Nocardioides guangzhouensis]
MQSLVAATLVALTATALSPTAGPAAHASPAAPTARAVPTVPERAPSQRAAVPRLRVTRDARGLALPWDAQPIGGGAWLVTERDRKRLLRVEDGRVRRIAFPSSSVWASGETGLMSLEIDPNFRRNGRFYACHGGFRHGGGHDVRVVAYTLNDAQTRARRVRTLLKGIQATSGRHGGCRLLITPNGSLLVGTGDAAVGTNPRNRRSLNGKVLRLNRLTGKPWPENPWPNATSVRQRYVLNYGHRNIQGLARRKDGTLWSIEHGSYRDDEVNIVRKGGDYGWNPVPNDPGDPSYNEEVPMTDQSLPGPQIAARWRSGNPTIATSGGAFVYGKRWGALNGTLAVAALKGSRVVFMKFDSHGRLVRTFVPSALRQFGRLRSVTRAPNGDLVITTANGSRDSVLRVRPRG